MKDLTGQRFGRYTVLGFSHRNGTHYYWKCRCDCGNEKVVDAHCLRSGHSSSCGCYNQEVVTKHGLGKSRLYGIYKSMKFRCYSSKCNSYENYGGRGIRVCDEWLNDIETFFAWAYENGYNDKLTIDRIDVNGDYCPQNCRWATTKEQSNNKRSTIYVEHDGKTKPLAEWAEIVGIRRETLYYRIVIDKWPIEEALTKPVGR